MHFLYTINNVIYLSCTLIDCHILQLSLRPAIVIHSRVLSGLGLVVYVYTQGTFACPSDTVYVHTYAYGYGQA